MINNTKTVLVSVEGLDCSFKETNVASLKKKLEDDGYSVLSFDFPQYNRDSSYFVRSFLRNSLYRDDNITIEDCYKYCIYYALDRYDTFLNCIKDNLGKVDVILFDRYVNSNLYNASRMMPDLDKVYGVIEWLYDFEYNILKLPQEDLSIFLRMPYEKAKIIRSAKGNKDLNEKDEQLSKNVYYVYDLVYSNDKSSYNKKIINKINNLKYGPHNKIYIDIGIDGIDFAKTISDEEEREKSKKLIFDKIIDESYIYIESLIYKKRGLYSNENK